MGATAARGVHGGAGALLIADGLGMGEQGETPIHVGMASGELARSDGWCQRCAMVNGNGHSCASIATNGRAGMRRVLDARVA